MSVRRRSGNPNRAQNIQPQCLSRRYLSRWPLARAKGPPNGTFCRTQMRPPVAGVTLALRVGRMQPVVKGMVQVHSVTYRIVRVRAGHYDVVRLLDDARVGGFTLGTYGEVNIEGDAPDVIREVARAALQGGRTTWAPRRLMA